MTGPNPANSHPKEGFPRICYIKNTVRSQNIEVGDYTYFDDPDDSQNFERNVLYHFPFIGDKLIIGKFCAIARGVKFIMNGANHPLEGFSTYPFFIFGHGWESCRPEDDDMPLKGDTIVGNDVWIGFESVIMPGVRIGDGAIVATKSVVVKNVEPYTVVGGNPAREIKRRFNDEVVEMLLALKWWTWDAEKITANLQHIVAGDLNWLTQQITTR